MGKHTHAGWQCMLCESSFTSARKLRKHMRKFHKIYH